MFRRLRALDARTMARLPRLALPGVAQHIAQRGNHRLPCFLDDSDRLGYLQLQALPEHTLQEIRLYLQQQRALGKEAFRSMVEARPGASPAPVPRTARPSVNRRLLSEPDPVFAEGRRLVQ